MGIEGPFAHALPQDQEQNIVITSCRRFEQAAKARGFEIHPLKVTLDKRLPVGSGLGYFDLFYFAFVPVCLKFRKVPQLFYCHSKTRRRPSRAELQAVQRAGG